MQQHLFGYMNDNYGVLLHCPLTGKTAAIDAGDADAYAQAAEEKGWSIDEIWITHHHGDHTAGLSALAKDTGALVRGPDCINADGIDNRVTAAHEDKFTFADTEVQVIATPGHTLDMLNFYLPDEKLLFSGDTLFTLGCGRVFEGDMMMMWNSLCRLLALPDDTVIYGSHEYTAANAAFAVTVDPDNAALKTRQAEILAAREKHLPTVPTTLAEEKQTNPFLRAADPGIRAHLNMAAASDADIFAEIRRRKDNF